MTTPLIEAIARAMVPAGEQWRMDGVTYRKDMMSAAQAALTAITEAGYAVVPVEPTERQRIAAHLADVPRASSKVRKGMLLYRAMISAAQGGRE